MCLLETLGTLTKAVRSEMNAIRRKRTPEMDNVLDIVNIEQPHKFRMRPN